MLNEYYLGNHIYKPVYMHTGRNDIPKLIWCKYIAIDTAIWLTAAWDEWEHYTPYRSVSPRGDSKLSDYMYITYSIVTYNYKIMPYMYIRT